MVDVDERTTTRSELTARVEGQRLDDVIAAVREFERKATAASFKAGFEAGWAAATQRVREAFASTGKDAWVPPDIANVEVNATGFVRAHPQTRPQLQGTTSDNVFSVIEMRPGRRGFEIVAALEELGAPVLERTVRTVLWRLKNAGRIRVVDGRWYTLETAPPDPLDQKEEAEDAAAK